MRYLELWINKQIHLLFCLDYNTHLSVSGTLKAVDPDFLYLEDNNSITAYAIPDIKKVMLEKEKNDE